MPTRDVQAGSLQSHVVRLISIPSHKRIRTGITKTGRVAVLTNFRQPGEDVSERGRGELVRDFLLDPCIEPWEYAETVAERMDEYGGMHLTLGLRMRVVCVRVSVRVRVCECVTPLLFCARFPTGFNLLCFDVSQERAPATYITNRGRSRGEDTPHCTPQALCALACERNKAARLQALSDIISVSVLLAFQVWSWVFPSAYMESQTRL